MIDIAIRRDGFADPSVTGVTGFPETKKIIGLAGQNLSVTGVTGFPDKKIQFHAVTGVTGFPISASCARTWSDNRSTRHGGTR